MMCSVIANMHPFYMNAHKQTYVKQMIVQGKRFFVFVFCHKETCLFKSYIYLFLQFYIPFKIIDYFSSYETGQSVGEAKMGVTVKSK